MCNVTKPYSQTLFTGNIERVIYIIKKFNKITNVYKYFNL